MSIHVIQVTDTGIQQQGDKELKYTHVIFKHIVNDKTPEMSKTSTEIHIALTLQKQWLLYVQFASTLKCSALFSQGVFMGSV